MIKFRWIKMSLFLMPVLQFTAAAGQLFLSFTVRVGEEVTLSCENVIDGQQKCNSTTWLFSKSRNTATVELIKLGQIGERAKAKSDRLSVTASCSLLIKKVTVEDVGRYDCQQFKLGDKQGPDSVVLLSVVTMTEHKDPDKVTLNCSVSTRERCRHTVKWLYAGQDVAKDNKDLVTSQSPCSASVHFLTSHFIHTSRSNFFTCEVTDGNKVQLFPFRLRPSGEKPGEDTTTATTESTTTENSRKAGITTTASAINDASTELQGWWWLYIIVAVVLVAVLVIAVAVIRWKRTKGNKTRMNDNVELTSNPAVTQSETSLDTADPEDGVSYASVSYTSKTKNSKARVHSKTDEGDAVTYAVVKASSADPSSFYATIN
ncbi:uncharacterized protein LOC122863047 isoform X2 [Siniperca chuatsi]|uniref:uncharacterized protein LOC122863047 isoform X2 n=1 Tax=Siniperca chuatsi TaxID=119488 RepID=UPI001CE1DDE7|nr:uncharacterized protein LOC122863047 isoform X2 [Siniperca chuatsi]